jgi:hypothetical protein
MRCHVCERKLDHDWNPYHVEADRGHYDDEHGLEVALGNHLFVSACFSCWFRWPDEHKRRAGEPIEKHRRLLVGVA